MPSLRFNFPVLWYQLFFHLQYRQRINLWGQWDSGDSYAIILKYRTKMHPHMLKNVPTSKTVGTVQAGNAIMVRINCIVNL